MIPLPDRVASRCRGGACLPWKGPTLRATARACPTAIKTTQRSRAIRSALVNSASFRAESDPTYCVKSAFRKLTRLSHMIQLAYFIPSSGPTSTCVDNPSPLLKTGAQTTVENRESISACRLATTKVRYCLGSPPGLYTRYNSPRITIAPALLLFARRLRIRRLILQNLRGLEIEPVRGAIDSLQISSVQGGPASFPQIPPQDAFDERRARLLRSRQPVNFRQNVFGECDRSLLFHTTIILLQNTGDKAARRWQRQPSHVAKAPRKRRRRARAITVSSSLVPAKSRVAPCDFLGFASSDYRDGLCLTLETA